MKKGKPTCPVPLFDKLVDETPETQTEAVPLRTYTRDQLKESIRREISTLLNHRQNLSFLLENLEDPHPLSGTVLFFGAQDFSTLNYRRDTAWQMRVEDMITGSINRFEPRLEDVEVEVLDFNTQTRILSVAIGGVITVDAVREQITFPIDITGFAEDMEGPVIQKAS